MRIILYMVILVFTLITGLDQAQGQDLEVTIDILEPSEEPGKIGPGIRYLEEKISRSPLKYQNYMELASAFRSIPLGKKVRINFNLRQRLEIDIKPIEIGDRLVKFYLKIWSNDSLILETELSLVRLGTVMVGSPGKPDLIIAISEGF
jgi:hypothetical protein